jgi:lysozyme
MKLSPRGSQVLIDREGCELEAYYDSVGVLTIGVGHTSAAGPPQVTPDLVITMKEAWEIFASDNDTFEAAVNSAVTAPMTQNQYDAFVSICFNIGQAGFTSSTFVESFNAGASSEKVTDEILWWDEPPEIRPRRQGEAVEFRDNIYVARIDPMPAAS